MKKIFSLFIGFCAFFAADAQSTQGVVINEIYAGGGELLALYSNDYIELRNTTSSAITMTDWSIQYSTAAGATWASNKIIFSGVIPANGFFLISLGSGGSFGASLPPADASGTIDLNLLAGKVVLTNSNADVSAVPNPIDPTIVDKVGWGVSATGYETAPALLSLTSINSIGRTAGIDTDVNATDFVIINIPNPQNSGVVLPVTVRSVDAFVKGNQLTVNWTSASETNNKHYVIEVSPNGIDRFVKVGEVKSKAAGGNSTQPLDYSFSATLSAAALGLMAIPAFLGLFIPAVSRRKRWILGILAISLTMGAFSCSKTGLENENVIGEKVFVRLSQVDLDGAEETVKVVQAVKK